MMTQWWIDEARKLGYNLVSDERARQYREAQIPSPQIEIDSED